MQQRRSRSETRRAMQLSTFRRACDSAYGALFQALLLPAWERGIRGRETLTHLAWLERTQWLSREICDFRILPRRPRALAAAYPGARVANTPFDVRVRPDNFDSRKRTV